MTERVLGPTGSPRRRRTLFLSLVAALALSLFFITGAQAVHNDDYFELGPTPTNPEAGITNILGNATDPGPDWADLFDGDGNTLALPAGGVAASFILDDTSLKGATDRTTFSGAGGSNKNNDPISGPGDTWHWDGGNVPAKDDIINAYAYATIPTSGQWAGDLVIYGGFERIDESGDSHIDLEFFQDDVSLDEPIPCNDPGQDTTPCEFLGTRTNGDIIVSMDFVQGGGLGTVSIRDWNGTSYEVDETLLSEGCNAADTACAFNNGATIDGGPWDNYDRSGEVTNSLLQNSFTEFGVNYSELVGGTPCISSVMGKTRSSQSFTAELKDFALSGFSICSLAWEKRNGSVATPHPLQGGATFSVSPNPHTNATGSTLSPIADCTAAPCNGEDKDQDPGQFLITSAVAGTYTITETAAPSGFTPDGDNTRVQTIGGSNPSAVVGTQGTDDDGYVSGSCTSNECDFHNFRPALKVTALGYTNAPTGSPTAGSGTVVYTAKVKNFGDASTTFTNSSLAVTPSAMDCTPETDDTLDITGTLAAGAESTFTLTCTYTSFADGTAVTASLNVNYVTNGLTRAASGSPASVSFTVQTD